MNLENNIKYEMRKCSQLPNAYFGKLDPNKLNILLKKVEALIK